MHPISSLSTKRRNLSIAVFKMTDIGYTPPPMEGRQIRAARALLGMSQGALCEAAGISRATLTDLENDTGDPRRSSIASVEAAFQSLGVIFTDDGELLGILIPKKPAT